MPMTSTWVVISSSPPFFSGMAWKAERSAPAWVRQSSMACLAALLVTVAPVRESTPVDWFSMMRGNRVF